MPAKWKAAGLAYLQYVEICADAVRRSLKEDLRVIASRRANFALKTAQWSNAKQGEQKVATFTVPSQQAAAAQK